jgi:cytochrome P450
MSMIAPPPLQQEVPEVPDDVARAVVLPESYTDPENAVLPAYKWLRENVPVGVARLEGYDHIWLITKYHDIAAVSKDTDRFHHADFNPILQPMAGDEFTRSINNGSVRAFEGGVYWDPPEHTVQRGAVADWFKPANVRQFEGKYRAIAKEHVARLMEFDGECDFVRDFATHYPLAVIAALLGVPPEDEPKLLKMTQDYFGGQDPELQMSQLRDPELARSAAARQWTAAVHAFYDYFAPFKEERRKCPANDLISAVVTGRIDGQPIPEMVQNGWLTATGAAGHDTTSSTIAGGMLGLIRFPEQFQLAKSDPSLIAGLVDESLRYATPAKHFMYNTTVDTELRGVEIPAMQRLMLLYEAGNRDPEVFADPDDFDITRRPNRHLSFGQGPHTCIGMHISRLEMRVLWEELLPRLESVELVGEPDYVQSNFVTGLKRLPIRFTKT